MIRMAELENMGGVTVFFTDHKRKYLKKIILARQQQDSEKASFGLTRGIPLEVVMRPTLLARVAQ